jgi:hypothetical protein
VTANVHTPASIGVAHRSADTVIASRRARDAQLRALSCAIRELGINVGIVLMQRASHSTASMSERTGANNSALRERDSENPISTIIWTLVG